jgi:hypothetical protein
MAIEPAAGSLIVLALTVDIVVRTLLVFFSFLYYKFASPYMQPAMALARGLFSGGRSNACGS